jgi:uncharacterized protein with HEPN domain
VTDDARYLEYIDRSIGYVQEYVAGGREAFLASRLVQDAVMYRLHTIAEATQRVSPAAKARQPDVDWRAIAGFRNVLVHEYMAVRLATVWEAVERDLPLLGSVVQQMLRDGGMRPGVDYPKGDAR